MPGQGQVTRSSVSVTPGVRVRAVSVQAEGVEESPILRKAKEVAALISNAGRVTINGREYYINSVRITPDYGVVSGFVVDYQPVEKDISYDVEIRDVGETSITHIKLNSPGIVVAYGGYGGLREAVIIYREAQE